MTLRRVRSIWQGKVGVHEKYIEPYIAGNLEEQDLVIKYGEDLMTIPGKEVKNKIVGKTDHPFQDRFSMESYNLYYFEWRPDPKPATLFD